MPSDYKEKLEKKMDKNIKVFSDKYKYGDTISDTAYKAFGFEQGFSSLMEQTIKLCNALERIEHVDEDPTPTARNTLNLFNSWLDGK